MRDLIAGERAAIAGAQVLAVTSDGPPPALALIALDADRRTAPAFPPIDSRTRELRPAAQFEDEARLRLDLASVPEGVVRLMVIAFDPDNQPIARHLAAELATLRFALDLRGRADAAVILVEFYRHQGGWRIAANGQGFAMGLSAIAAAHGIDHGWVVRLIPRLQPGAGFGDGPRAQGGGQSSGSGVAIARSHILTNAHVVEGARTVLAHVGGRPLPAELVFADTRNDLALLQVREALPGIARFRSQVGLHLGEDVVALGFPLQGLLGTGPQASAGNVAALCGIGNDSSVFQFTAPIASGNSGGPILDMAGHLIGLVCSSLNLDRVRERGGVAENINFGIKAALMLSFLDSFGIEPQMAQEARVLGRADVVRQARDRIARVTCEC